MDTKLKMSVIMAAVDKITAPIKKVTSGTSKLTETMKASKVELEKISNQQKDIEHFKQLKKAVTNVSPELKKQQALVDKLGKEYTQAEKPTAKMTQEFNVAKLSLLNLSSELKKNQQSLQKVRGKLSATGIQTNKLAAHTVNLRKKTEQYNTSLANTKAKLKAVSEHEARLSQIQSKRAKAMQSASNMAIAGASVSYASQRTVSAIKGPLQAAAEFEAQMSKVKALTKANEADQSKMIGQARQLGAETVFGAKEVAQAQEYLALAGFKTNQILAATPATLKLASAGGLDLARASDIASDSLTAFGLKSEDMSRLSNVLAATANTSNTQVSGLGEALKIAAPIATKFGGSVEEVSAMLAIMADSGIKGGQAGTALAAMYGKLNAQTPAAKKALAELGVEVFDLEGKSKKLPDLMKEIAASMSTLSDKESAPLSKALFGSEAGISAGVTALLNASDAQDKLNKKVEFLNNLKGGDYAGDLAKQKNDNLVGTVKSFDSAMESMKISAGTALIPTMKELTIWVTTVTRKIDKFAQENPNLVKWLGIAAIAFAAITAVLGPLMIMVSAMAAIYGTLTFALSFASAATARFNLVTKLGAGIMKGFAAAQWLVNAAFAASPIGKILVGVMGLIALAAWLVDDWGSVGQWFLDLWEGIKNGVGKAVDFMISYFNALMNPIDTLIAAFDIVSDFFSGDDEKTVNINKKVNDMNSVVAPAVATALTASTGSMPALANDNMQIVPANPIAQQQSKQLQVEGDKIEIKIAPTPGMDSQAIAALVQQELAKHQESKARKLRGMLND